jgi:hypothetical protein
VADLLNLAGGDEVRLDQRVQQIRRPQTGELL